MGKQNLAPALFVQSSRAHRQALCSYDADAGPRSSCLWPTPASGTIGHLQPFTGIIPIFAAWWASTVTESLAVKMGPSPLLVLDLPFHVLQPNHSVEARASRCADGRVRAGHPRAMPERAFRLSCRAAAVSPCRVEQTLEGIGGSRGTLRLAWLAPPATHLLALASPSDSRRRIADFRSSRLCRRRVGLRRGRTNRGRG